MQPECKFGCTDAAHLSLQQFVHSTQMSGGVLSHHVRVNVSFWTWCSLRTFAEPQRRNTTVNGKAAR